MSDTRTTRAAVAPATSRGHRVGVALWVLQILLAVLFAAAALPKLGGAPAAVAMFATIGVGQWFRYAIGVIELAGAIGLLVPRLAGLAALGLAADMIGATATQVVVFQANQWLPASVLVLCAVVVWGRWPRTSALVRAALRRRSPEESR